MNRYFSTLLFLIFLQFNSYSQGISVPTGMEAITLGEVPSPRQMALDTSQNLYVTSSSENAIYKLEWKADHYDKPTVFIKGLNKPFGLTIINEILYTSQGGEISKIALNDPLLEVSRLIALPPKQKVQANYLKSDSIGNIIIHLYTNCNSCIPEPPYATLISLNPLTLEKNTIAFGLRASYGFDTDPETGVLWVADKAIESESRPKPKDEINALTHDKMHFGYPFCHQGNLADEMLGNSKSCDHFFEPVAILNRGQGISAIAFYSLKKKFNLLVASLGDFRSVNGQIQLFTLNKDRGVTAQKPFIKGKKNKPFRPIDILALPTGEIVISDMASNSIISVK